MAFQLARLALLAIISTTATSASAQDHDGHMETMQHAMPADAGSTVTEPGQSAFAAIQEIVAVLDADPETAWERVDVDALRDHLVDMDNVTLHANIQTQAAENGAEFRFTSSDPAVQASIRSMVMAHAATMTGTGGLQQIASPLPDGALLRVTGDPGAQPRILGLGAFGILSLGAHHQAHHLAIARGEAPHAPPSAQH